MEAHPMNEYLAIGLVTFLTAVVKMDTVSIRKELRLLRSMVEELKNQSEKQHGQESKKPTIVSWRTGQRN